MQNTNIKLSKHVGVQVGEIRLLNPWIAVWIGNSAWKSIEKQNDCQSPNAKSADLSRQPREDGTIRWCAKSRASDHSIECKELLATTRGEANG